MFNNRKIADLERKLAQHAELIRATNDEIAILKQAVIVGTGQFEQKLIFGLFGHRWVDVEKTAHVNKVLRAIVDHLGLQIVATAEKTETTPERVTVQLIDKAGSDKRD